MTPTLIAQVPDRVVLARFVRAALSQEIAYVPLSAKPEGPGRHTLQLRIAGQTYVVLAATPAGVGERRGYPLRLMPLDPLHVPELTAIVESVPRSSSQHPRSTLPDPEGYDPEAAFISAAPAPGSVVTREDTLPFEEESLGLLVEHEEPQDELAVDDEAMIQGSVVFDLDVLTREQQRTTPTRAPPPDTGPPTEVGSPKLGETTDPLRSQAPFTVRREFREVMPGRVIAGKYEIESLVGSGAVGAVYRARHNELARLVAVKVLHPYYQHDRELNAAFRSEARAASGLLHPNAVIVHDVGDEPDGLVYIVMEFVEGRSLQSVLDEERRLSTRRALAIVVQVCAALAAAHEHGVVHRDVKPDNIMLVHARNDDGLAVESVKVCDFGIAAIDTAPPDAVGFTAGTPTYMAPEQALGLSEPRTDIYACGVLLYELLTGRPPFVGDTPSEILAKHARETPKPPRAFAEGMPASLETVILRALGKHPSQRQPTMRDLRAELKRILSMHP